MTEVDKLFCITKVSEFLQDSLQDEDNVKMDEYLKGYKELNK